MIVVDLRPEGYQLIKLREIVLEYLSEGAKAHLLNCVLGVHPATRSRLQDSGEG